ncbi:flavin monoamine oxidase family protein [Brucella grignonensis]|uniref:FAD binding domain protein n=1 Tax=Brucella grignonensis TaxID=94627 RepID=A0A256FSC5_9HYPH|nr:FAD-dependent oxidoreductase [Brucella grignonensis]OYR17733.1 FAD binding domain protein [Brucella grignonensis]
MMRPSIIIIGGGLAGLTAARLLHHAGINFELLEARNRLGGRILSADATGEPSANGFDLGPSWFWPAMQPELAKLVAELGLSIFAQNSEGDIVFQRTVHEKPQRYPGMRQEPPSMRIAGGTGALVTALASRLPAGCLHLGSRVTDVRLADEIVELRIVGPAGAERSLRGSHVIFALPPRLLEATIAFTPALDAQTTERWRSTPTWMAPQAKFFALYKRPFWRETGLSGAAQSLVGPLVEIHDATTGDGAAALFGFIGVPAEHRIAAGRDAIIAASVRQLTTLFGAEADTPIATLLKDWAADPLTATTADRVASGHPLPDRRSWVDGRWSKHVLLAGSETSTTEPGYLAGAVEAAGRVVGELIGSLTETHGRLD